MDRRDMDSLSKDPQDSCGDLFKKFASVVASAQQELISGLQSKQVDIADTARSEVILLKRRLHDEKMENSKLNQKISELTEGKRRSDLSLELAEDCKIDLERKLLDEISNRRAIEKTLAEKNSLIDTLQAQIIGFTMHKGKERANVSSYSTFVFGRRAEDEQVTTTTKSTTHTTERLGETLSMHDSIIDEDSPIFMDEFVTLPKIRIKSEHELGPHTWDEDNNNNNQEYELEQIPTAVPQQQQQHEEEHRQSQRTNLLYSLSEFPNDNVSQYDRRSPQPQSSNQQGQPFRRFIIKVEPEGADNMNDNDNDNEEDPDQVEDEQNSANGNENTEEVERQEEQGLVCEPSSSKKKSKRKLSRMDRPCPASRKRTRIPSPTPTLLYTPTIVKISKKSREESNVSIDLTSHHQNNIFLEPTLSTLPIIINDQIINKELQPPVLNNNNNSSSSSSLGVNTCVESSRNITELYKQNYGFDNNWLPDNCPYAREFWYDNSHESFSKYLVQFHDDRNGRWANRRFHFKEQVGLEEPKSIYSKYDGILQFFSERRDKTGIRIFLDVREFNFFSKSVSKFFTDFGPYITHFSCSRRMYSKEELGGDELLEFVLQLSNLEYLCIDDEKLKRLDTEFKLSSKVRDLTLTKLKSLRLISTSFRFAIPFIMAILLRAPNLSHVYGLPIHLLSSIEKSFKSGSKNLNSSQWLVKASSGTTGEVRMDCVKSLLTFKNRYKENPRLYLENLITLIHLQLKLEEVDTGMSFISNQNVQNLCKVKWDEILHMNVNNLKLFRMEIFDSSLLTFPISIPRLGKCETLVLDMKINSTSTYRYFPVDYDLPYTFPNLNTVVISLDEKESILKDVKGKKATELFNNHFPVDVFKPNKTFQGVHRINLINFPPKECIEKFQQLFPNITILELHFSLIDLNEILPLCFKFYSKLKQLFLNVTFVSYMDCNLDSAFTGMPTTTCKSLENLEAEDVQERISQNKRKPSINNLKDLTLLKMVLNCRGRIENKPGNCIMTKVSAIYGFGRNRMPKLTTVVGFDRRLSSEDKSGILRILQPMKGLITIDESLYSTS